VSKIPLPAKPIELDATGAHGALVVKIGGALLESADQHRDAFAGIVALHAAERAQGRAGVVLVHGGGAQVDRQLKLVGIETPRIEGIRVTSREAIQQVVGVLAGSAHVQLLGILSAHGARPVGLSLSDGGLCRCRHTTRYAFDAGEVGEIVGGDGSVVRTLLSAGFLPVVNSIGLSDEGAPLNVNADEAACAIARIIGDLDESRIDALISDGTISGGMVPKVRSALEAALSAGCPATIASWRDPAAIATGSAGTRIHASTARPALAR
jgi:acetylglutamate kinase